MVPNAMDSGAWITGQFSGSTYMPNNMDVQHEPLYDTLFNSTHRCSVYRGFHDPESGPVLHGPYRQDPGPDQRDHSQAAGRP